MKHRIRAAALVTSGDRLLLVRHRDPVTHAEWWVPPGGGLEAEDGSVFDCAVRETFEEAGLTITASRIAYLSEYFDTPSSTLHFEIFVIADSFDGELTIENNPEVSPDYDFLVEAKWIPRSSLNGITVYPAELKDSFWQSLERGFPTTQCLERKYTET